ncbi:tetratricopeptide repeat protein [Ekhidna sp.]|uniref:tetratricopeptide repeat protein n=1 Tax=Ekhidna sp. TaxID=2608089 RepID=UPI003B514738
MEVSQYIDEVKKAIALFNNGAMNEAMNACSRLIKERPERKGAYLLLAQIYSKKGELQEAENTLKTGLEESNDPDFHSKIGIIQSKMGLHNEAVKSFSKSANKEGDNEMTYFYHAKSLTAIGLIEEAIHQYKKSLQCKPGYKMALNNLANLLYQSGKFMEAIKFFRRLTELYPEEAIAYCNLGSIYEKQNQLNEARRCYEKSLKLDPSMSIAYFNLAQLLGGRLNDFRGALTLLDRGLKLGDSQYQKGIRFYQILYRQHVSDWSDHETDVADLNRILEESLSNDSELPFEIVPYSLSHSKVDNHLYRRLAERYAKTIEKRVSTKYPGVKYDHSLSDGKMKIGYYSPNMRLHPGGLLVRGLFDYHDSSNFEIHAFSLVKSEDFVSKEIKNSVDYYHDISTLDTLEIANLINRKGIDILVSLAFYNTAMNVEVLALRPSPLQMVLIGSHETTGASFIDYAFSDESMMDKEIRENFTENIITLPCSLLLNSELPVDESINSSRSDHGLPENAFIYTSFNHPRKLDPETFDAWMEILKAVPDAVLWIYDAGNEDFIRTLKSIAKKKGVLNEQIVFAPPLDIKKHWERIKHADLFLDSFNYNAHVTGVEALRMGMPILTMRGDNHNSRLGSSLVHYSNLPNCAIFTKNDYIERSIQLAVNRVEINTLKKSLQSEFDKLIFDTELQVKYLEKAYQKAFLRLKKKLPPKDFSVGSALRLDSLV